MEMETITTQAIAKKLWNLTRVIMLMIRKGFAKSKLLLDLTLLLKRTNKLAGKALHSLLLSSSSSGGGLHLNFPSSSCKSSTDVDLSYEFSFNNSPAKRNRRRHRHHLDEAVTMAAVQRVLETINFVGSESPDIGLPGFGNSPAMGCRQLRVTDSPFPMKENEEERIKVNKAADEFIKRFYKDLRLQKSLTSPIRDTCTF